MAGIVARLQPITAEQAGGAEQPPFVIRAKPFSLRVSSQLTLTAIFLGELV